jgi:hypothetical protein
MAFGNDRWQVLGLGRKAMGWDVGEKYDFDMSCKSHVSGHQGARPCVNGFRMMNFTTTVCYF